MVGKQVDTEERIVVVAVVAAECTVAGIEAYIAAHNCSKVVEGFRAFASG